MAEWDHRSNTSSGAYQMYFYNVENTIDNSGNGTTYMAWEVGLIKVASSGGYGSSQGSCPWQVYIHGYNNGDVSGTGSFSFGANDAIGTRRAIANIASGGWGFSHDPAGSGALVPTVYAAIQTGISIGSPQVGPGAVTWTSTSRAGTAPATPTLNSRESDTAITIRTLNSTDWGVGTTGVAHSLERSLQSNFSSIPQTWPVTTVAGGGAAQLIACTGLAAYTTHYFRTNFLARNGGYYPSAILTVYSRPSKPDVPTLSASTQTSLSFTLPAPSYVGGGITARETQISTSPTHATILATDTTNAPVFNTLNRVTRYYVRSRQVNSAGTSDWSATVTADTVGSLPSAPTGYSAYDIASTSATVSLGSLADNGGAAPDQVRVKISSSASDSGLINTITSPEWAPVRINGLTKGVQYYVAEAAHNNVAGGGWGPYGAWVPFTTKTNVPNAPVLSLNSASGTTAVLQWAAPTQLNGATIVEYHLLVARNPGLTQNTREIVIPAGVLAQVVDTLLPATQYYATLWTVTDNGLGSASNVLSFNTSGGGGSTSGVWIDVGGVPKFAEVWLDVGGVPKLTEVWIDIGGIPKQAIQ